MTKTKTATEAQLVNFSEAFDSHIGTCRATCDCGKEYFDNVNSGIDWEPGEYERLEQSGVAAGGSVGIIECEGRRYVHCCDCWRVRAQTIVNFLGGHHEAIIAFFKLEQRRLLDAAKSYET